MIPTDMEGYISRHVVKDRSNIDIYNADCMDMLKQIPDKAFDLAIVDPPYGINVNVSMGRRKGDKKSDYHKFAGDDKDAPPSEYFHELFRVSKDQIIWGANHFISRMPMDSACWIMWDKGFSEDVSFAQFELAWTSMKGSCKKFDKNPNQQHRIHPTQKPVELYEWILTKYGNGGGKILDTHLGSGSIAIACHNLKFDLTAFELDTEYYEAAVNRFEQHRRQIQLF